MNSTKSFYHLLFWLIAIVATTVIAVLTIQQQYMLITTIGLISLGVLEVYAIFRILYRKDRQFEHFIDAVSTQDASLLLAGRNKNSRYNKLYAGYQRVLDSLHKLNQEKMHRDVLWMQTLKQIDVGILAFDATGNVVQVNDYLLTLLNLSNLHQIAQLKQVAPNLTKQLENLEPGIHKTIRLQCNQQQLHLSLSASVIKPANHLPYKLVSIKEISLETAKTEQEAWQKMIRILRHEVTNSISPVRLISGSLLDQTEELLKEKQYGNVHPYLVQATQGLQAIYNRSEGLINFVERYKVFNDLKNIRQEPVHLHTIAQNAIDIMAASCQHEGITLEVDIESTPPPITGDAQLLNQVLINLIKNAIEATKDTSLGEIMVRLQEHNTTYQMAVEDTGIGIPYELQEEVFTPFFTTKKQGSGIGLSLSRQIVLAHGGQLTLHSKAGAGTSVILTFPAQNK